MTDPHATAGAETGKEGKLGNWFPTFFNSTTGLVRTMIGGYFRKLPKSDSEKGAYTPVEGELERERVFEHIDRVATELERIEIGWDKAEELKDQIEEAYENVNLYHAFTEKEIKDEIRWTEYGTDVRLPKNKDEKVRYRYRPITSKIKFNGKEFNDFNKIVDYINLNKANLEFAKAQDEIIKIIEEELSIPDLVNDLKNVKRIDDLISQLMYPGKANISYTPLKINPVTLVHFDGGDLIGEKENYAELKIAGKSFFKLEDVFKLAESDNSEFEMIFLRNIANRELFYDWVAKEIGLKHLGMKILEIETAKQFIGLFGGKSVAEYREFEYIEDLMYFGVKNLGDIIGPLNTIAPMIQKTEGKFSSVKTIQLKDRISASTDGRLAKFTQLFSQIKKFEEDFYDKLNGYIKIVPALNTKWDEMFKGVKYPKYLFFYHTYEVTKRFSVSEFGKDNINFFADAHHNEFKRMDEIEAGLDHRGWPLEVYKHNNKYYVLIDHWFNKIAENRWQMEKIAGKCEDEQDMYNLFQGRVNWSGNLKLKNQTEATKFSFTLDPLYNNGLGREVKTEFVTKLDLLDAITYLCYNWDAYRDDFRDGRFHKHSKTYYDYVLAAHRYDPVYRKPHKLLKGWFGTYMPNIKILEGKHMKWNPDPWKRKPMHGNVEGVDIDEGLPWDERKVTTDFVMEFIGRDDKTKALFADGIFPEGKKGKDKYKRAPRHMSPAFDRLALVQKGGGHGSHGEHAAADEHEEPHRESHGSEPWIDKMCNNEEWIHWGRMYYYEGTGGINKWSENPDPAASTRGTAKYVIDRVIRLTNSLEEAKKILRGHKYDFGVRKQSIEMTTDPLGGADKLLRFGKYLGNYKKIEGL